MKSQVAAIPFRRDQTGGTSVLLVRSRTRKRWIIPKGKIGPRMLPSRSAEREAFEEAGVLGKIGKLAWVPTGRVAIHLAYRRSHSPSTPSRSK